MPFPLITDPYFYAVSIPAVLLLGISKSGFGAGFGSLAVPMMALAFPPKPDRPHPPKWLGAILTVMSGFTSFIAHAGGPPVNAYVIPMRLSPLVFAATMSVYFTVLNLSKWVPYAWLGLLDLRNMATSVALLPFAPIGVWVGVRLAHRVKPQLFYRLVYAGMLLTGVKLEWDGFVAR